MLCLSTTSFSVCVNGEHHGFLEPVNTNNVKNVICIFRPPYILIITKCKNKLRINIRKQVISHKKSISRQHHLKYEQTIYQTS